MADAGAASAVCKIAADLAAHESTIQYTSLYAKPTRLARGASFSSTLATLWQTPSFALFGRRETDGTGHVDAIDVFAEGSSSSAARGRAKSLVWLSWDDVRRLHAVFRSLEYVDAEGRPTPMVDSYVSRLADTTQTGAEIKLAGVQASAWTLISRVFARARALRVSADAGEVCEGDATGVLAWFPRLEVLDVRGVPRRALRFWDEWAGRACALRVQRDALDIRELDAAWARLAALDLSGNAALDVSALAQLGGALARVARLSLARCGLAEVPAQLALLSGLETLDLSANAIGDVADIAVRLGNVTRLDLSANRLHTIDGLGRLWALEELSVAENELDEWTSVLCLRNLPALRALRVRGNPFAAHAQSRAQIFSAFDHRDVALALDGHAPTAAERREMARIPRVATAHRAGVPADARRRPKVATIEESADTGPGPSADTRADEGALREKPPRVLRASELQAVRRRAGGRRATATTARGVPCVRAHAKHTFSVPSSFTSRPSSPAPSLLASSVRAPSLRDPERYRRRVEMMRAEAGASWLRAFAELRQQAEEPSLLEPPVGLAKDGPLPVIGEASTVTSSPSSPELAPAETRLPSFLFPRRRGAAGARKREIARLPHYSPEKAGEKAPGDQRGADVDDPRRSEGAERDADSEEPADDVEEPAQSPEGPKEPSEPEETELERLRRGDGVEAQAAADVVRFRLADGHVIQQTACGQRTVFVTDGSIVEADASEITARVARGAVTRVLGDVVEVKASRHERAEWVRYAGGGVAVRAVEAALGVTDVFRRAECLRCGWRGVVDAEHAALDVIAGIGGRAHGDSVAEDVLRAEGITACPACGRQYMREYFADDDAETEANGAQSPGIRALVGRRQAKQRAPKTQQSKASRQRETDAEAEAARREIAESALQLGAAAPFAEATNAVRLHLQLSVFEEGERLLQWVSAGLVRQVAAANGAKRAGRARARSGAWGLAALLGSEAEAAADAETDAETDADAAGLAEQAVRVALSTRALYVFSVAEADADDAELRPAEHLRVEFALALTALGRIDVGPNRQYLALHAGLLGADGSGGDALPRLGGGGTGSGSGSGPGSGSGSGPGTGSAASCVLLVRDRLRCSDVLDALAEIGYETRALDAGGAGSGRQRAINHDVEWAMHHLVQQVFLRAPATCGGAARAELRRSRSTAGDAEPVDAASGDDVIVDRVTYEFLQLYVCAGVNAGGPMRARTVVATRQFAYVVRERVDVWPPPVHDLRVLYRRWQRAQPPMIVTSDPDTYDPATAAQRKDLPEVGKGDAGVPAHLSAALVCQYDCVDHARPVRDLRRAVLVGMQGAVGALAWRAALRLDWDTVSPRDSEGELPSEDRTWVLWFATAASARECGDALVGLARAAGGEADLIEQSMSM